MGKIRRWSIRAVTIVTASALCLGVGPNGPSDQSGQSGLSVNGYGTPRGWGSFGAWSAWTNVAAAKQKAVRVYVDSAPLKLTDTEPPYWDGEEIMLPLRPTIEALGLQGAWDELSSAFTVTTPQGDIVVKAASPIVFTNGVAAAHKTAPQLKNGTLYVAASLLRDHLHLQIRQNEHTGVVTVASPVNIYIAKTIANHSQLLYYTGERNASDQPNGSGKWTVYGAPFYEGDFAAGQLHGTGKLYRNGELLYEGTFKNNRAVGNGTLYESPDRYYFGAVQDGLPHGEGTLYINGQIAYNGNWKTGFMDGNGKVYDARGTLVYAGQFVKNERYGYGIEYENGRMLYAGNWVNGVRNGSGKLYDVRIGKPVYSGGWQDGQYQGAGHTYKYETITWYRTEGKTVVGETRRDAAYVTPVTYVDGTLFTLGAPLIYMGLDNAVRTEIMREADRVLDEDEMVDDRSDDHLNGTVEIRAPIGSDVTEAGVLFESELLYVGMVRDGKKQGYGREYEMGELVYAGTFDNDVRRGQGQSFKNGLIAYDGQWRNGRPHGHGRTFTFIDKPLEGNSIGSVKFTEGMFQNGTMIDEFYRYEYYGPFKDGVMNGFGVLVERLDNGKMEKRYEGSFADGKFNGEGKLYEHGGRLVYKGQFVDDKREGQGEAYFTSGDVPEGTIVYKGSFKNDVYSGTGTLYYSANAVKYEGQFELGQMNGTGRMYYDVFGAGRNGNMDLMYEGTFLNGEKYGYGKLYDHNGWLKYEGAFVDDQPVEKE